MKQSVIQKYQELHNKVIHAVDHKTGYTDEEYLLENKLLKKLNNAVLNLICPTCFPLLKLPKYAPRTMAQYAWGYPKIKRVVDAEVWNNEVGK